MSFVRINVAILCKRGEEFGMDLRVLLASVEEGNVIERMQLAPEQIDVVLNRRDDAGFDGPWVQTFGAIAAKKAALGLRGDADPLVTRLRKAAYISAFRRWKSADLAAAISDDFGLIGDALILGYVDPRLDALLSDYLSQVFPSKW